MPLLFNDKPLTDDEIRTIIGDRMPHGKDKKVTFTLLNHKTMMRLTEKGERMLSDGGTRALTTSTIATINGMQGVLTYYETKTQVQVTGGGIAYEYMPKYFHFKKGVIDFDADKNVPKFAFLLAAKQFDKNAESHGAIPIYRLVDTSAHSKKKVSEADLMLKAYDLVREAYGKNKAKLRALYEYTGATNYNELKAANDFDSILAPLYNLAQTNPKKLIELMESAALDTGAKVTQAIETGILKSDAQGFYWVNGGKKIWACPQGRGHDALDLFVDYLRNQDKSGVLGQLTKELDKKEAEAALVSG